MLRAGEFGGGIGDPLDDVLTLGRRPEQRADFGHRPQGCALGDLKV